jgi:streptomycin 6-kinase
VSDSARGPAIRAPDALVASHTAFFGDAGRAWLDALPRLAADHLARWALRRDGPVTCGAVAVIVPVRLADATPGILKLQPIDEETAGEPVALRAWDGDGAVRLLRHDPDSGTMLLERLDAGRSLGSIPDDLAALRILCQLMARLNAVPAPEGLRNLGDVAADMLARVPRALRGLADRSDRRLIRSCAAAVAELLPEPGDRLLHWDLHYDNVLARLDPPDARGQWLAIDPKPMTGDPGFELLAALHNRWDEVVATGDVARAVTRRFDLMTELIGADRRRAAGWTLGRILQNLLWERENSDSLWHTAPDRAVAAALLPAWLGGG